MGLRNDNTRIMILTCQDQEAHSREDRVDVSYEYINGLVQQRRNSSALAMDLCLSCINKANLRDLIAATGLVILLKLDSNRRFFSPCDLEIWWMTLKNNRAPLLYYIKLYASFQIHRWIKTGVTVRKRSIQVKIGNFWSHVTLKFDGWPWKTIGHLFYAMLSFFASFQSHR